MKPESDFHSTTEIPWTEISATSSSASGPGVTEKILSFDPEQHERKARLIKMEPGFRGSKTLTHDFWEEVYIIQGSMIDELNNIVCTEGYYCCRQPDMPHGPFYSPNGCFAIEFHYVPKEE